MDERGGGNGSEMGIRYRESRGRDESAGKEKRKLVEGISGIS